MRMIGLTMGALCALVLLGGEAAAGGEKVGEIGGDKVRLRAGPSTRHAVLATVDRGMFVVVLGREGRWIRVRLPGSFPCFVHESLVRREPDGKAVVMASRVLLRVTPGKELLALETVLERGEVLEVLGGKGEWVRVLAPDRAHLYVYETLVAELGPAAEYRQALFKAARARRKQYLGERAGSEPSESKEELRRELRDAVLALGEVVLAGEGRTEGLVAELRRIGVQTEDDLTRGYASALLALLGLREDAERLREEVARGSAEREEAVGEIQARLKDAQAKYEEALQKARVLKALRSNPFRAIGVIEGRDGGFVLTDEGRVVYQLVSERFRLEDYVGRKVGLNGRMVITDPETGRRHLKVEGLEILAGKRPAR